MEVSFQMKGGDTRVSPQAQNPGLLFQGHNKPLCSFRFLPATAQGSSDVSVSCPGWGWSLLGQELCCGRKCFQHGRSSLSCCPRAPDMRLSIPFMFSLLPLTLFFFWTFIPLDDPLSLTYLSAHFILRAQPGLFQSPTVP